MLLLLIVFLIRPRQRDEHPAAVPPGKSDGDGGIHQSTAADILFIAQAHRDTVVQRLRAAQRDRSEIIIEALRSGLLELCNQSREEIHLSADLGEGLGKGVAGEALTAV